jgi:hypothetical protein
MKIINGGSLWRTLLIIGVAVIAIPVTARISSNTPTFVPEQQANIYSRVESTEDQHANKDSVPNLAPGHPQGLPQAYYNRRRQYVEDRVERRIDRRQEYLDRQTGDDEDSAGADDEDGGDDEDASSDRGYDEEDRIESRREYLRDRAERRWN